MGEWEEKIQEFRAINEICGNGTLGELKEKINSSNINSRDEVC